MFVLKKCPFIIRQEIHDGKHIRIRIEKKYLLKYSLGSSISNEPIVDDGDFQEFKTSSKTLRCSFADLSQLNSFALSMPFCIESRDNDTYHREVLYASCII
jgi:hypothetical protein